MALYWSHKTRFNWNIYFFAQFGLLNTIRIFTNKINKINVQESFLSRYYFLEEVNYGGRKVGFAGVFRWGTSFGANSFGNVGAITTRLCNFYPTAPECVPIRTAGLNFYSSNAHLWNAKYKICTHTVTH